MTTEGLPLLGWEPVTVNPRALILSRGSRGVGGESGPHTNKNT